jgi:carboxymethylenebutenolidase
MGNLTGKLNPDQEYFVEEFYEDYREGLLTRREFIKRVAFVTGSMAATVMTMGLVGCEPEEIPAATEGMPTPQPPAAEVTATVPANTAGVTPVPGAQSPLSVAEGDPAVESSDIALTSQGETIRAYLTRPVADGSYAAVLVCHENRGLTPHIRDVARRFAKAGYVALAIDLLAREGGTATLDPDQVPGLLSNAAAGRHVEDFKTGFAYLQSLEYVDGGRIGMTGYCFGGGVTWDVATEIPELRAAVPFYGRGPDLAKVAKIAAAVLGVYAENDSRINAGLEALREALDAAGVTYQFNIYPGVDHAFHNDTGTRYVEEQALQAWQDTLAWFAAYLVS